MKNTSLSALFLYFPCISFIFLSGRLKLLFGRGATHLEDGKLKHPAYLECNLSWVVQPAKPGYGDETKQRICLCLGKRALKNRIR